MFTLRTLFIVVAIAALGVAAVVSFMVWLMSAFVVATLGILCWAFLERQQPFWRGFLVFGTAYLVCACVSTFGTLGEALPSTWIDRAVDDDRLVSDEPYAEPNGKLNQLDEIWEVSTREATRTVTHCIGALLFGAAGGLLYAKRVEQPK
jgi:hypothetical protein